MLMVINGSSQALMKGMYQGLFFKGVLGAQDVGIRSNEGEGPRDFHGKSCISPEALQGPDKQEEQHAFDPT